MSRVHQIVGIKPADASGPESQGCRSLVDAGRIGRFDRKKCRSMKRKTRFQLCVVLGCLLLSLLAASVLVMISPARNYDAIHIGMTRAEVRGLLGKPDSPEDSEGEADRWDDLRGMFIVAYQDGKVALVGRIELPLTEQFLECVHAIFRRN